MNKKIHGLILENTKMGKSVFYKSAQDAANGIYVSIGAMRGLIAGNSQATNAGWRIVDVIREREQRNNKSWHSAEVDYIKRMHDKLIDYGAIIKVAGQLGRTATAVEKMVAHCSEKSFRNA